MICILGEDLKKQVKRRYYGSDFKLMPSAQMSNKKSPSAFCLFLYQKEILKTKIFYGVLMETGLIAFRRKILKSKHTKEDGKHNNNYSAGHKRQPGCLPSPRPGTAGQNGALTCEEGAPRSVSGSAGIKEN